jgi:hypothetical protein
MSLKLSTPPGATPARLRKMEAHIDDEKNHMFMVLGDIIQLGRVVYQTIQDGRVPKRERVLTINGTQYRLTLSRTPRALTITPVEQ